MRVIERRNRAGLALEPLGVLGIQAFDGHEAIDTRVAGLPHLAHTARAEAADQFIGAECGPGARDHAGAIVTGYA